MVKQPINDNTERAASPRLCSGAPALRMVVPVGGKVVVADRWYPSSKTCSVCGQKLTELSLGTRTWVCSGCGTQHDRDQNAAQNLKQLGEAIPKVKPVERKALVGARVPTKLASKKQELYREHSCSQER
jgi:hypothetical protein